jgi:protein phosphatase
MDRSVATKRPVEEAATMSLSIPRDPMDTAEFVTLDELVSRYYEPEPQAAVRAEFGARTHPGNVRSNNEDNYLIVRRRGFREVVLTSLGAETLTGTELVTYTLAVADGMGGHKFGDLASLMALRSGWELGGGEIRWTVSENRREAEEMKIKARLYFQLIHRALQDEGDRNPRLQGMGTTLTVCYTAGRALFVVHVGDSRAYLFRGGQLRQLTRDHTLAQERIDAGKIEPDSPEAMRVRHILTNSLGAGWESIEVDVDPHRLEDGDRLLLCTDGLTDLVTDDEVARILDEHADPNAACRALVDRALDLGGGDNVTAVVGRYEFPRAPG